MCMKDNKKIVRTRYAPSPTGFQHIGGIRTAIFNYFLAKNLGGKFIIRIEDTDANRFVAGTEKYILDTLAWLNIPYDEGPNLGGEYGPYRQSERIEIYKHYALELIARGHAYFAFDTADSLDQIRAREEKRGLAFIYNYKNRLELSNSLSMSENDTKEKMEAGIPYVIRLKLPENRDIVFTDLIRGEITVNTSQLDDRVLLKSDGWATYHLSNVIDDKLMAITHTIRGEEWLPSAPIHYYLYEVFGWESYRPAFAHLPLILNPDGDGKLSKRKLKDATIPIFPLSWKNEEGRMVKGMREEGFLPEAVINILILLGWSDVKNRELFSRSDLESVFSIVGIQRSGAKFDYQKAKWINAQYIKAANDAYLKDLYLSISGHDEVDIERLEKTILFIKSRISTLKEIDDYKFLFALGFEIPKDSSTKPKNQKLQTLADLLIDLPIWDNHSLKNMLEVVKKQMNADTREIYSILREAISGNPTGPDVVNSMLIIGKEETLKRLSPVI